MMFKYFWKLICFSATDAVVGDMSVSYLNTKNEKKKNDRRFVIPVPKLATLLIFSSIGRFFKPGDFFGPSPIVAFPQFPPGINLKPAETRQ